MKFVVSRTSMHREDKPCETAVEEVGTYKIALSYTSLKEAKDSDWKWNYVLKENKGKIVAYRKQQETMWTIDISSLEKLIKFIDKYEKAVVKISNYAGIKMELEIYDDWRE